MKPENQIGENDLLNQTPNQIALKCPSNRYPPIIQCSCKWKNTFNLINKHISNNGFVKKEFYKISRFNFPDQKKNST